MNKRAIREFLAVYGNNYREKREKAKLKQLEVAKIIGCSQAIISHIECGYMLPPEHIEKALNEIYEEI